MTGMKTAIVTGGGGGLGAAIARRLAAQGYLVGVLDHDGEAAKTVASSLSDAVALQADVTDEASVASALGAFNHVPDLLVNNAGIVRKGSLFDQSVDDFRRVVEVNLIGTYIVSRVVGRAMAARRSGVIVNMSSVAALVANSMGGAYGPSKAGVANLTQVMALEFGPLGIRVNSVAPGLIASGMGATANNDPEVGAMRRAMVPAGDLGTADDVADAVLFLASDSARYIHGHQLVVDGAVTHSALAQMPLKKKTN